MHYLLILLRCLGRAAYNTIQHDGIEHAGYLAFLGLLSLFPFLVFVAALAGWLGEGEAGAAFITMMLNHLPSHLVASLQPRIVEIISGPPQGLLTVAILGAVWTASSAVEGLRTVLNRAYHVATPPAYIWRRLLSIAQLLLFAFILIVGMLLFVLVPVALQWLQELLGLHILSGEGEARIGVILYVLTPLALFIAVSYIYYVLPNIRQNLVSVVPGAALVMVLWIGSARVLTLYLSRFEQVNLIYGSLGGIIASLIFFYISNIIFIFGAEFNYLLSEALGLRLVQKEKLDNTPTPTDSDSTN